MNSDERILQILENSACLSKGQLLGYIKKTLYPEELRAVELHLNTCALCNDALEGLELQQDVEKLLTGMLPPVLPTVAHKEKPKEKKESHAVVQEEKVMAAAHKSNTTSSHTTETAATGQTFRPRRIWVKPLGVAAGLILAFGALWYFEFNKDDTHKELAQQKPLPAENRPAEVTDTVNPALAAAPVADEARLKAAEEKKHKDSLFLAKKEAARLQAVKDTAQGKLLAKKTEKAAAEGEIQAMTSRSVAANAKESTAVADGAAKKPAIAAAPPAAARNKDKEEPRESKKELSDYELGLQKYKEKNYASALMYFKSSESDKKDPRHWEAVYYSALCNKNLDKKRKAVKLFEKVIDANAPQKKAAQKQLDEMKKAEDK